MKKFFKILGLAVIAAIVLGTFYMLWKKSQPKITVYEVLKVERRNIEMISVATGKVEPRNEVLIKPQISGIISERCKEAGDHVKAGEVIAVVKVIPEMASLNSAESRVRMAEINLKQVKTEYERQKTLFEKGVITGSEMDKVRADYDKSEEELNNARNNLDIVRDGISRKMEQQSNTQVRSTIDGTILDIPVKVGNSVIQSNTFNDGTTIASVANMSDMIFIGKVDETEVGRVHSGMPIKLTIGAINDRKFDASLEYISPKGVEINGAIQFEIKAAAKIPDTVMVRAGYSANAEIVLAKADSVLTVPESTLTFSGDTTFVHILTDSVAVPKTFVKRAIRTGLSDGINVEVKEGVEQGMKIRGNPKITPSPLKR
ncbi:MAG: efflux RND transporter periplasmic adaptor subunit [Bacteroidales bacterium]|jgi:HlyD family secretion protein|nr:efflux RND transporter periplasmic adaptor subunit [Bacteroidales bacterium]